MKVKFLLSAAAVCMAMYANAENKTVSVATPGTLNTLVTEEESTSLTGLTVTGAINDADLAFIHSLDALQALDLRDAQIEAIPDEAFKDNKVITSLVLPASVTVIGKNAFEFTMLQTIDFSPCTALKTIDEYAFYCTSYLKEIDLSNLTSLESIKENAFNTSGDATKLAAIGVTETAINLSGCSALTTIDDYAFTNNKCSTSIDFSGCSSLSYIGNRAFNNSKVVVVNLKDCLALTTMPYSAFNLCSKITDIVLPANLESMGEKVFPNAGSSLNSVTCLATVPPTIASNTFSASGVSKATLIVPESGLSAYETADNWKDFGYKQAADGIRNITRSDATLTVSDNGLEIAGIATGETVSVFNPTGMQVAHITATTGNVSVPLTAKGIYMVQIGKNVVKVVF